MASESPPVGREKVITESRPPIPPHLEDEMLQDSQSKGRSRSFSDAYRRGCVKIFQSDGSVTADVLELSGATHHATLVRANAGIFESQGSSVPEDGRMPRLRNSSITSFGTAPEFRPTLGVSSDAGGGTISTEADKLKHSHHEVLIPLDAALNMAPGNSAEMSYEQDQVIDQTETIRLREENARLQEVVRDQTRKVHALQQYAMWMEFLQFVDPDNVHGSALSRSSEEKGCKWIGLFFMMQVVPLIVVLAWLTIPLHPLGAGLYGNFSYVFGHLLLLAIMLSFTQSLWMQTIFTAEIVPLWPIPFLLFSLAVPGWYFWSATHSFPVMRVPITIVVPLWSLNALVWLPVCLHSVRPRRDFLWKFFWTVVAILTPVLLILGITLYYALFKLINSPGYEAMYAAAYPFLAFVFVRMTNAILAMVNPAMSPLFSFLVFVIVDMCGMMLFPTLNFLSSFQAIVIVELNLRFFPYLFFISEPYYQFLQSLKKANSCQRYVDMEMNDAAILYGDDESFMGVQFGPNAEGQSRLSYEESSGDDDDTRKGRISSSTRSPRIDKSSSSRFAMKLSDSLYDTQNKAYNITLDCVTEDDFEKPRTNRRRSVSLPRKPTTGALDYHSKSRSDQSIDATDAPTMVASASWSTLLGGKSDGHGSFSSRGPISSRGAIGIDHLSRLEEMMLDPIHEMDVIGSTMRGLVLDPSVLEDGHNEEARTVANRLARQKVYRLQSLRFFFAMLSAILCSVNFIVLVTYMRFSHNSRYFAVATEMTEEQYRTVLTYAATKFATLIVVFLAVRWFVQRSKGFDILLLGVHTLSVERRMCLCSLVFALTFPVMFHTQHSMSLVAS